MDQFARTELVLGREAVAELKQRRVAIFGVGGVGGYAAEALVRSGVGAIDLFDDDRVCLTNLNRQLIATRSTVGQYKVDVMEARLKDINPAVQVTTHKLFYLPDTADSIDLSVYDYVVDAVDTVTAKLELICRAKAAGVPVISAMGAGNKIDPGRLKVADIYETRICPLARVMRRELRKRGVNHLTVCYSTEEAHICTDAQGQRIRTPGSISFVPGVAGLMIAGEVVRKLTGI